MAQQPLQWFDLRFARRYGTEHFLVAGATGSGKSTVLGMLLQSVLGQDARERVLLYDSKTEALPSLYSMCGVTEEQARTGASRVKVLHPLDRRSCSWDLSDIDSPLSARQFATILAPRASQSREDSGSFFRDALVDLLTGVLLIFINCTPNADSFQFRDVLLAMLYEANLRFVLSLEETREGHPFPVARRLRRSYLEGDARLVSNILATINSTLSVYEAVGAAWHHSVREGRKPFSMDRWVEDDCNDILVLGNDEAARAVLDPLNQAVFQRAVQRILTRREASNFERENGKNQTWFFLDEVREAGVLEGLSRLLTKGRSKNCCVALGFQDIEGMRAVYGAEVAHELCGQCAHVGVLRLNSPSTASWSVDLFGKHLGHSASGSHGIDSEGKINFSAGNSQVELSWLYTDDFLYLPPAGPENGIHGFVRSPEVDPHQHDLRVHLPWSMVSPLLPKRGSDAGWRAPFLPRPVEQLYLSPWNEEDWRRLGFPGEPPEWRDQERGEPPVPPGAQPGPRRLRSITEEEF